MDRRFIGILVGLVVIFGAIFLFTQKSDNSSGGSNNATNHVTGQGKSGVTLVEYGDYECPVCEAYQPTIQAVQKKYNKQVFFQFRNLPLSSIHPNALAGARAAEAAGLQNKFWQMHDLLYSPNNWASWSPATDTNPQKYFDAYAKQLGLDTVVFDKDFASSQVNDSINADIAAFQKTGQQQATPSYFVDGTYVDNAKLIDPTTQQPTVAQFSKVIQAAIDAKAKQ